MHSAVKLELDKTSALELPAFEPEEIDYFLNKAMLNYIKAKYAGLNMGRESFEQTQQLIDDLRILVKEHVFNTLTAGGSSDKPYSYLVNIDTGVTDYMYRVGDEVMIQYTQGGNTKTKRIGVTECTSDTYNVYIANPFSEHRLHHGEAKPLRLFKEHSVELVTDGTYQETKYYFRYLRFPTSMSITTSTDCELPTVAHHEIVDMAVAIMLENIESNRYSGFKNETAIPE